MIVSGSSLPYHEQPTVAALSVVCNAPTNVPAWNDNPKGKLIAIAPFSAIILPVRGSKSLSAFENLAIAFIHRGDNHLVVASAIIVRAW